MKTKTLFLIFGCLLMIGGVCIAILADHFAAAKTPEVKAVDCYDSYHHKIQGLTCEEETKTNSVNPLGELGVLIIVIGLLLVILGELVCE